MIGKLGQVLAGTRPPALYQFPLGVDLAALADLARDHHWALLPLDGRRIHDKARFLTAMADLLRFPPYFGHNWDAFEEMLTDLAWLPPADGIVLVYDRVDRFARRHPQEWATARAILAAAVAYWAVERPPFVVLLRGAGTAAPDLPWL